MDEDDFNDTLTKFGFKLSKETYIRLVSFKVLVQAELKKAINWNDFFLYFLDIFNLMPSESIHPQENVLQIRKALKKRKKKHNMKKQEVVWHGNFTFKHEDKYISLNKKGDMIRRAKSINN